MQDKTETYLGHRPCGKLQSFAHRNADEIQSYLSRVSDRAISTEPLLCFLIRTETHDAPSKRH